MNETASHLGSLLTNPVSQMPKSVFFQNCLMNTRQMSAGIYSAFPLVLFNSNLRDKLFGNLPRVFSAGAEETDECEGQGADEVDKQVLHGIKEPNIQIPAEAEALSVDGDIGDVVQEDWNVAVCWVQHDAGKAGDYGILLHIHTQQPVHGELEEFPQNTDGHGKTESNKCEERR